MCVSSTQRTIRVRSTDEVRTIWPLSNNANIVLTLLLETVTKTQEPDEHHDHGPQFSTFWITSPTVYVIPYDSISNWTAFIIHILARPIERLSLWLMLMIICNQNRIEHLVHRMTDVFLPKIIWKIPYLLINMTLLLKHEIFSAETCSPYNHGTLTGKGHQRQDAVEKSLRKVT